MQRRDRQDQFTVFARLAQETEEMNKFHKHQSQQMRYEHAMMASRLSCLEKNTTELRALLGTLLIQLSAQRASTWATPATPEKKSPPDRKDRKRSAHASPVYSPTPPGVACSSESAPAPASPGNQTTESLTALMSSPFAAEMAQLLASPAVKRELQMLGFCD